MTYHGRYHHGLLKHIFLYGGDDKFHIISRIISWPCLNTLLCIKSDDGQPVNVSEVEELVTSNGVQVSKASVSKMSGDMYIDRPSEDSRDKLIPLLNEASIPGNRLVNIKQKCPTISLRNVMDYGDESQFIEKVKNKNRF